MGMFLGMIMACSNVYIGLKAGWSMGVTITSAVLAFTFFQIISGTIGPWMVKAHKVPVIGPFFQWLWPENHYSILENNCLQSTAGAAGSMTSGGLVNAIPALMMLSAASIPADFSTRCLWLIPWVMIICAMGVFLAVPTKRQMINVEGLRFPHRHRGRGHAARAAREGRRGGTPGARAHARGHSSAPSSPGSGTPATSRS
jgi:uncharacterized oligopeptide transporter (OPT) family protein